jgi:hypothetical protein
MALDELRRRVARTRRCTAKNKEKQVVLKNRFFATGGTATNGTTPRIGSRTGRAIRAVDVAGAWMAAPLLARIPLAGQPSHPSVKSVSTRVKRCLLTVLRLVGSLPWTTTP